MNVKEGGRREGVRGMAGGPSVFHEAHSSSLPENQTGALASGPTRERRVSSSSRSGFCLPDRSDKKITRREKRSWASLSNENLKRSLTFEWYPEREHSRRPFVIEDGGERRVLR